jgi:hypothetical protein
MALTAKNVLHLVNVAITLLHEFFGFLFLVSMSVFLAVLMVMIVIVVMVVPFMIVWRTQRFFI